MYDQRLHVLHLAWSRFHKAPADGYAEYLEQQKSWLDEYVLFMAVKAYYNDGPWTQLAARYPDAPAGGHGALP